MHLYAKFRDFEPPKLPATDPKIRQHLTFSSFGIKFLIYHFKRLSIQHFLISDCSMTTFYTVPALSDLYTFAHERYE